ncbi:MAG: hypothetical protein P1U64_13180 [Alcanivoracaceae bacterium]|nr:hypothetical protein [Alcanivoracaceae bacterium]
MWEFIASASVWLGAAIFLSCVILLIIHFITLHDFEDHLRTSHPALWKELGRPHVIKNNTPKNAMRTVKYIHSKKWMELDDEKAEELAKSAANQRLTYGILMLALSGIVLLGVYADLQA